MMDVIEKQRQAAGEVKKMIGEKFMLHAAALLDSEQSRIADRAAIKYGTPGSTLMENAGRAVADVICESYKPCPTIIVCGTGNNGGDGFVVARWLRDRNWPVTVTVAGDEGKIRGDANTAKHKWELTGGTSVAFEPRLLQGKELVVDAIFGTGLDSDVAGDNYKVLAAINNSTLPVVSVDIPSGIDAANGALRGIALTAAHTVTFVRPKLGHVLLPGKAHAGQLHVFDIGISGDGFTADYFLNIPSLWADKFPKPGVDSHKYTRGHAIVIGGGLATTGAAKLTAMGALRAGAGLVSIACTPETLAVYAAGLTAIMTKPAAGDKELDAILSEKRVTALCIGPGYGIHEKTRERVVSLLKLKKPTVLDADALSAFKGATKTLFSAIGAPTIMTPHEGEFERLFATEGLKHTRAREAAKKSGAVVVLKGNDTVIAAPDGRLAINAEAPVWLATAGSGDVLSGIITGLLAQGMPAFEAACAGVWLHSRAASIFGPGLIAEDISPSLPAAFRALYNAIA